MCIGCIFFGVCRYNISSNQVNSYLNIMRFNWCIMVFILLLVKANKILVRLTSIRSFFSFRRFVLVCMWACCCCFLFGGGGGEDMCLRIVKREPHLVKKNYGNFVKWNKNKCKKAQQSKELEGKMGNVYKTRQREQKKGRHIKYIQTHSAHTHTDWTKQSNNTAAVNIEHVDSMKKTFDGADDDDGKTGATRTRTHSHTHRHKWMKARKKHGQFKGTNASNQRCINVLCT